MFVYLYRPVDLQKVQMWFWLTITHNGDNVFVRNSFILELHKSKQRWHSKALWVRWLICHYIYKNPQAGYQRPFSWHNTTKNLKFVFFLYSITKIKRFSRSTNSTMPISYSIIKESSSDSLFKYRQDPADASE